MAKKGGPNPQNKLFCDQKLPAAIRQEFTTSRHLEFNRWEGWGLVTIKTQSQIHDQIKDGTFVTRNMKE